MSEKNGGPAFPVECHYVDDKRTGVQTYGYTRWEMGMTLRDYFAAKAMQGLIGRDWRHLREGEHFKAWAVSAYEVADAMLTARESM